MIAKCVSAYPNQEQLDFLGTEFFKDREFHVTAGDEYVVLGLTFVVENDSSGRGLLLEHVDDYGHLVTTPACLFDILDGTVSRYWQIRVGRDGMVTLWPPSFYRQYYHDDLSENVTEVVEDFKRIRRSIEIEALRGGQHVGEV